MSKALATKNVAAVLLAVSMVFGVMFTFATPARAQTLESLQAQIQALLAQISALQGGTPTTSGACITFTRNHSMGNTGGEVMDIQKFLNSASDTMVATTGAGSPGNETSYFGGLTKAAVVKFQNKYASSILTPVGLSAGTGYWGPSSRAKANALFTVPAGGVVNISVRSNIATGTSGEQVGVQLNSVAASGALDTSVVLPIAGGIQTISSATIGTVAVTYTGPDGATDNPATEVRVFEGSTVVSTHAANLQAVTFENRGTSKDGDLRNFKLYVDGVQVGSTMAQTANDRVTFDLSAAPKRLETGTRIIKVLADIVGGSSYTYDIQIRV